MWPAFNLFKQLSEIFIWGNIIPLSEPVCFSTYEICKWYEFSDVEYTPLLKRNGKYVEIALVFFDIKLVISVIWDFVNYFVFLILFY